jgi:hypothetical protein
VKLKWRIRLVSVMALAVVLVATVSVHGGAGFAESGYCHGAVLLYVI